MALNRKRKQLKNMSVKPEAAVAFLEDVRLLSHGIDEPNVTINLKIPSNILRAVKAKAKFDGEKYQSLIVEYLRFGISNS